MHFWELTARFRRPRSVPGSAWPRKIGLNWFIPALVKRSVGSSTGTTGELGTTVCPPPGAGLPLKNSMNVRRISSLVGGILNKTPEGRKVYGPRPDGGRVVIPKA